MAKKRAMGHQARGSKPNPRTQKNSPHQNRKNRWTGDSAISDAMSYLQARKIKVSIEEQEVNGKKSTLCRIFLSDSSVTPGLHLQGAIDFLHNYHKFLVV